MAAKSMRTIILSAVVFLTVAVSASALSWYVRRDRYHTNYPKIQAGDAKQVVVELLGQPTEVTDCYDFNHSAAASHPTKKCTEEYWYRSFLEQWVFVFDGDSKVITKSYNILY